MQALITYATLGACRTWGVESENRRFRQNRPQRDQFLPDLQPNSRAIGQKDGKKWAAAVDLQPTIRKSDRLLGAPPIRGVARASHGFTAIELMVVVAIMAILVALAGPSFTPLIERWRVRDAAETLTSSIYYARSEAIKRGGNIIIIKNPNSGACTTATGDTQWGCGWRVFFDANSNGAQDACVAANTPNECDLQVTAAPTRLTLTLASSTGSISIDRWGMHSHTDAADSTPDDLTFKLMPQGKANTDASAATLCAGMSGRIMRKKGSEDC